MHIDIFETKTGQSMAVILSQLVEMSLYVRAVFVKDCS